MPAKLPALRFHRIPEGFSIRRRGVELGRIVYAEARGDAVDPRLTWGWVLEIPRRAYRRTFGFQSHARIEATVLLRGALLRGEVRDAALILCGGEAPDA